LGEDASIDSGEENTLSFMIQTTMIMDQSQHHQLIALNLLEHKDLNNNSLDTFRRQI
jgi:hypothetical protein